MIAVAVPRREPRTSGLRLGTMAAASVAAAWVQKYHNPGVLCPLRRLTGVPCPFCGSTTVFMEAGGGHWSAALAASPLAVAAAVVFLAAPLLGVDPVRMFDSWPARTRWIGGGAVLFASWLWQLHRFGFPG